MIPKQVLLLLWSAWVVCWVLPAGAVKRTSWRESPRSRASHLIPAFLATWLLVAPRLFPSALQQRIFSASSFVAWLGVALVAAGLAFSVWARIHLGRNWSGLVTVKEGHELVRTGPYRRVRHPIYTGIILAFVGTTLTLDQWRALIALVLITASLVRKLHIEEARMGETFPGYADYRRGSAALFPFIY